jgi:hypothetical protein
MEIIARRRTSKTREFYEWKMLFPSPWSLCPRSCYIFSWSNGVRSLVNDQPAPVSALFAVILTELEKDLRSATGLIARLGCDLYSSLDLNIATKGGVVYILKPGEGNIKEIEPETASMERFCE